MMTFFDTFREVPVKIIKAIISLFICISISDVSLAPGSTVAAVMRPQIIAQALYRAASKQF